MQDTDILYELQQSLLMHAIVVTAHMIESTGEMRYIVRDTWWDISILFKSERLFPDQTKYGLTYEETLVHCQQIVSLIEKFY